jgi:hypothetical protein
MGAPAEAGAAALRGSVDVHRDPSLPGCGCHHTTYDPHRHTDLLHLVEQTAA